MKKLLEKFNSMKKDYNTNCYFNPTGLITFKNSDMTIFAQYHHNMNFEKWFRLFVEQWNVKDIINVEKTKFGLLIVEVR